MSIRASINVGFEQVPFLLVPGTGGDPSLYPEQSAGLRAGAPFATAVENASTVLYRILLPANATHDFGSDPDNEGFLFDTFPAAQESATASVRLLDPNGLPVDFTTIYFISIRVRKINPDEDAGGTVDVITAGDLTPGNVFGIQDATGERTAVLADPAGWPGSGSIEIHWHRDTAATIGEINLMVEISILGDPA